MYKADQNISDFLETGFDLRIHLATFLQISLDELNRRLPKGIDDMAAIHPGSLNPDDAENFYEEMVGDAHLLDLASWHLNSSSYIADTLRLQKMFACGQVLDFGGGIGTHAIAAASLPDVEHVWFVDLNPINRDFVRKRAISLGLEQSISVHRDLQSTGKVKFDTLVCLDVLEHIPNPSDQLNSFCERIGPSSTALMNWYFFKGNNHEYPFHFDDPGMIEQFFFTLQSNFIELFHPFHITTRAYKPLFKSDKSNIN